MKDGQLDRNIVVQRSTSTLNGYGEAAETWAPVVTLRVRLVTLSADELITGAGQEAASTITFESRFADGITVADRLEYEGRPFDIRGVAEIGRRAGLTIRAVARPS